MTATAGNRSKTVFLRECVQKRNIFSGAIIEIVSLGTLAFEDLAISGLS
jgi:aconitase B